MPGPDGESVMVTELYCNDGQIRDSVTDGLVLDLVGSDYSGGSEWASRVGALAATVPTSVSYATEERAFRFTSEGGGTITVPFATNPSALAQVTYEVWLKLTDLPTNKAWVVSFYYGDAVTGPRNKKFQVRLVRGGEWDSELAP